MEIFDRVILAAGVVGNVEGIGLEGTGVEVDRTHIVTNEWTETGEPHVYAIGDVAGPPWLAHKATHEGILCAERIAGEENLPPLKPFTKNSPLSPCSMLTSYGGSSFNNLLTIAQATSSIATGRMVPSWPISSPSVSSRSRRRAVTRYSRNSMCEFRVARKAFFHRPSSRNS